MFFYVDLSERQSVNFKMTDQIMQPVA